MKANVLAKNDDESILYVIFRSANNAAFESLFPVFMGYFPTEMFVPWTYVLQLCFVMRLTNALTQYNTKIQIHYFAKTHTLDISGNKSLIHVLVFR